MKSLLHKLMMVCCTCAATSIAGAADFLLLEKNKPAHQEFNSARSEISKGIPLYGLPWANGRFVYEFSPEVLNDAYKTSQFEAACERLLKSTALRCIPHSWEPSERDFVYVIDGPGNFSNVGRQGGKQLLSISIWNNPIIISHEIKHALGWGHEQQNPERDFYIEILFENISDRNWGGFTKFDNGTEGPYDFDSMMHYGPTDFARPSKKSILARLAFVSNQNVMGQRNHLSDTDIREIRNFYGSSSERWCGVNRKPTTQPFPGCELKCELQSDPTVGAWVPDDRCKTTSG